MRATLQWEALCCSGSGVTQPLANLVEAPGLHQAYPYAEARDLTP